MMPTIFLYVAAPAASVAFYADLFGIKPIEESPTFAMLILPGGLPLGLVGQGRCATSTSR